MVLPSKAWSLCVSTWATPLTSTRLDGEWSQYAIQFVSSVFSYVIIQFLHVCLMYVQCSALRILLVQCTRLTHTHTHTPTHAHTHTPTHAHTHTLPRTHTHTHSHAHTHTLPRARARTHTHTHSTKLFIRFPETLFKTEDLYQQKKHDLGKSLYNNTITERLFYHHGT